MTANERRCKWVDRAVRVDARNVRKRCMPRMPAGQATQRLARWIVMFHWFSLGSAPDEQRRGRELDLEPSGLRDHRPGFDPERLAKSPEQADAASLVGSRAAEDDGADAVRGRFG